MVKKYLFENKSVVLRLGRRLTSGGLALKEMMTALALGCLLTVGTVASYTSYGDKLNIEQAEGDLLELDRRINAFQRRFQRLPHHLGEIGGERMWDPWGNQYLYKRISTVGVPAKDARSLNSEAIRLGQGGKALNNDYDLYSRGKDGGSSVSIDARESRDDVIRANNGRFIGKAEHY